MRYITLEQCKAQAVVEHDADDTLIIQKATAAERSVENYLECSLDSLVDTEGKLPEDIIEGILLFFCALYANREGFSTLSSHATASMTALLKPYKTYGIERR